MSKKNTTKLMEDLENARLQQPNRLTLASQFPVSESKRGESDVTNNTYIRNMSKNKEILFNTNTVYFMT